MRRRSLIFGTLLLQLAAKKAGWCVCVRSTTTTIYLKKRALYCEPPRHGMLCSLGTLYNSVCYPRHVVRTDSSYIIYMLCSCCVANKKETNKKTLALLFTIIIICSAVCCVANNKETTKKRLHCYLLRSFYKLSSTSSTNILLYNIPLAHALPLLSNK